MISRLKSYLKKNIPAYWLIRLFPSKFTKANTFPENSFFSVDDNVAQKKLHFYIRHDSFMEKQIWQHGLYGDWEKESLKIWAWLSKRSDVILDIGANTGIFSMVAASNHPSAKIVAVEPIDVNFNVLQKNIIKNKFDIQLEKVALSDRSGTAVMRMLKDRLNYMTSVNDDRYSMVPELVGNLELVDVEVPIIPFSILVDNHGLSKIDLVKLDVEGHEMTVLNSMESYINRWKPTVLIEIIGDENAKQIEKLFLKYQYQFISIDEKEKSRLVDHLWDNNHHNFLICQPEILSYLRGQGVVE